MTTHTMEFLEIFTGGQDFSCEVVLVRFKDSKGKSETPSNHKAARIKTQGKCTHTAAP